MSGVLVSHLSIRDYFALTAVYRLRLNWPLSQCSEHLYQLMMLTEATEFETPFFTFVDAYFKKRLDI